MCRAHPSCAGYATTRSQGTPMLAFSRSGWFRLVDADKRRSAFGGRATRVRCTDHHGSPSAPTPKWCEPHQAGSRTPSLVWQQINTANSVFIDYYINETMPHIFLARRPIERTTGCMSGWRAVPPREPCHDRPAMRTWDLVRCCQDWRPPKATGAADRRQQIRCNDDRKRNPKCCWLKPYKRWNP